MPKKTSKTSLGCGVTLLGLALMVPACCLFACEYAVDYNFNRQCTAWLKLAADSNSIDTASQNLNKAIRYLEANRLTEGNTAVIFPSPATEIGPWYKNLKDAQYHLRHLEIADVRRDSDENTALVKLRETLLDHTEKGDRVTVPAGIEVYPHALAWCLGRWVTGLLLAAGTMIVAAVCGEK